jgi:hypothetical protein
MQHGIPNLAEVEPGVWRGGQPTEAGWLWLQEQGVKSVVKLDTLGEGNDSPARELGMTVSCYPINFCEQVCTRPRPCQLEQAVQHIHSGTYIHCKHGQDRTGLAVACYRLKEGWSKKDAEKEMMQHGFHKMLQGLYGCWQQQKEKDWTK